jgi:cystathionine beta-lyase family protein involved in aluminum resistance
MLALAGQPVWPLTQTRLLQSITLKKMDKYIAYVKMLADAWMKIP